MEPGVADQDAVVVLRVARGGDHAVATAVGAAAEVAVVRRLAVGDLHHALGHRGQRLHRLVAVVQPRLRIAAEQRVLRIAVPGIGADDRKAHAQRIVALAAAADIAERGDHVAVQAAVGLVEEAPVPCERQTHLEADRIGLAVAADAFVHQPGDLAVRADRLAGHLQGAGRHAAYRGEAGAGIGEPARQRVARLLQRCRRGRCARGRLRMCGGGGGKNGHGQGQGEQRGAHAVLS
ncbi:hypothetical protein NB723_003572 [Xanthomonas sacchari]|nr:hypothetical protein [Xanthomonas sacchari]